ncbi:MAG TPA: hypothetical protein VN376_00505 [Longilinea sp.]|nr:hypothetical protein [Longilinea sp.]
MATSEERLKVLKMIQEGKLNAEEGLKLLEALGEKQPSETGVNPPKEPRYMIVKVTDTNSGRNRVNLRLPVSVLQAGAKVGARFTTEVDGLDITRLLEAVRAGETGQIVDVVDEKDGERVQVFLE